jgi:RHS repeat-associated protein
MNYSGGYCNTVPDGGSAVEHCEAGTGTVGKDGTIYIDSHAYSMGPRIIREIRPDRKVYTIAGGNGTTTSGNGGAALLAGISGTGTPVFAEGTDGSLYFTDNIHSIRRILPPLPNLSRDDIAIASEDGREMYIFTRAGKHQRTVDTFTGAVRFRFEYDASGRLARILDVDNNATTFERDGSGNPLAIVAPGGQRTTFTTDTNGYLASITDPGGHTETFGYSSDGLMTAYTDGNGNPHSFQYDTMGRLSRDDNPEGGFLTLTKTDLSNGYSVLLSNGMNRNTTFLLTQDSAEAETRTTTYPTGARKTRVTPRNGVVTETAPDGTLTTWKMGPDPRFRMEAPIPMSYTVRTPSGLLENTVVTRSVTLSNPADPLSLTSHTETVTVNGKSFTESYTASTRQHTSTSAAGRVTAATVDAKGKPVSLSAAPAVDNVLFGYDPLGRLSSVSQGGLSSTFGYDNAFRLTTVTDPEQRSVTYGYDNADRVSSVTLPSGRVYSFGYDNTGNRTSITMPSGAVHTLGYNKIHLDNSYTPPGNAPYQASYNLARDWVRTLLPSGRALDGAYDNGGRMTGTLYPEGTVTVTYGDNTARPSSLSLKATDNVTQSVSFTWDGPLVTRANYGGVSAGEYRYSYDNDFRVKSFALDNAWTSLSRDNDGLLTKYGRYDFARTGPGGAPATLSDNTLSVSYGYDSFGRLSSRTHTVAGMQAYQLTLGYDNAGRIATRTETIGSTPSVRNFRYDMDGQLFQVLAEDNVTVLEEYGYDNNANRTRVYSQARGVDLQPEAGVSYDGQDRMVQQGGVVYGFGADGYLTQRGTDLFTYSARGELLSATAGGQTVNYRYDAMARRVSRTDGSGTTKYLYGNPGNPFQLTASRSSDNTLTTYSYDTAGNLFALERAGSRYYVATDQLGTPKVVTDNTGAVVKQVEYDAWGVKLSDSAPTFDLPVGFAGGIPEATTGLVRFGFRDYEPGTGRWVAKDPILFRGGINLFLYSNNNPVVYKDPSGLATVYVWLPKDNAYGHASITLDDGTHISWWPAVEGRDRNKFINNIYSAPANDNQTMGDDIFMEGRDPDYTKNIIGLDEQSISSWWEKFKGSNQWKTLSQNCSTTVAEALKAGGADNIAPWWPSHNIIWTPGRVMNFSDSIK